ncbi:nitrite reductase small subunit NirD [Endozoicomonas ascidiicola]|uniref:nitrite reductase small subunit NirD n=1 Tax=Endozoicomonas ascidiicola TaxID=1698521 RepID=UPI000832FC26|nr:nitrite reductase small subunit NirD [Endozoicomonas ascidiicola]
MSQWIPVCQYSQLTNGLGVCALVNGQQVAVFCVEGELFALDNFDPFSEINVISRGITGDLKDRLVVASPIYKQHFDLRTGQCLEDDSVSLNVYPIETVDGVVQVMTAPLVKQVA